MKSIGWVMALSALAVGGAPGCEGKPDGTETMEDEDSRVVRPRSSPIEFVGVKVKRKVSLEAFEAFVGPLFGAEAKAGDLHADLELQPGLFLSVYEDDRTDEQRVVEIEMLPMEPGAERRTVLRVPVSLEYGEVYTETVRTAVTTAEEKQARDPGDTHPFNLSYRAWSPVGGALTIDAAWEDGETVLTIESENPRTSLRPGEVNSPAFTGEPFEVIGGTVWFSLTRDQFDFFVNRAYGVSNGAAQNFDDFQLLPHGWLRITVTPMLEEEVVDVQFDVVTLDGDRIPFARAPASYVAGEQFMQNVMRLVENMEAQEAAEPGSSDAWEAPFHYDDPEGGGVVKVIAQGEAGEFRIAYAVDSPIRRLRDVSFVDYKGDVDLSAPPASPVNTCEEAGSEEALEGTVSLRFDASSTVRGGDISGPLRGNIYGSVYRAEDVTVGGPKDGAESVVSFRFENVDLRDGPSVDAYPLDDALPRGSYQVLGFIDTDGNADPSGADPSVGDPVAIPIGDYEVECAEQEFLVEFAIPLPESY